jgi:site-specific DNA recombinase
MKTVTYARFSSDAQNASSIEDQERNCLRRAETEGWQVIARYADAAMTGSNNLRPDYLRMLADAKAKAFDVLIVDDLSRLTRDSVEQERTIRALEFAGVRLLAVSDGYDSTSKARKIQRMSKGMMNEMFLDDLSERVHRGSTGKALKGFWNGGRPYGYKLRQVTDPSRLDPYGAPARIGTRLEVDAAQGKVVAEIFHAFAVEGLSLIDIAARLNARGEPSAGSTWRRVTRRNTGWMSSSVRNVLRNPLYTGKQRWNTRRFLKEPETGRDRARKRPESEWVVNQIEALRIVSDTTFDQAAARFHSMSSDDPRLKTGGRPKHLLSGQLKCSVCGANYVLVDRTKYACASHWNGRACANRVRVRKDALEAKIIKPLDTKALEPRRVAMAVRWMKEEYARRCAAARSRTTAAPLELADLDARLARLKAGVADLEPDELAAAVARVESKRRALLESATSDEKGMGRVFDLLPRAAEAFRATVAGGLAGDPTAVAEARLVLRPMLGPISLEPGSNGELWANYGIDLSALVRVGVSGGRGDRI